MTTVPTPYQDIQLKLTGLNCAGCVSRAEKALAGVEGVSDANVNLATSVATIQYAAPADVTEMAKALQSAGYPAEITTTSLNIEGMHCASCVGRVENALKAQTGVTEAHVNLATEKAIVQHAANVVTAKELTAVVAAEGYVAKAGSDHNHTDKKSDDLARLKAATICSIAGPACVCRRNGRAPLSAFPPFHCSDDR